MKYRANASEPFQELCIKALDSMVIGSIIQFIGTTIPTGWLECNGATITQSAYPELYSLIGGTLPDFRGRVLVGQDTNDTDFDTLLETGGSKELQEHSHTTMYSDQTINVQAGSSATCPKNYPTKDTGSAGTGNSGNLQPYAVVKHIIKAKNTTPTMASIVNTKNNSTEDAYSCDYINGTILYEDATGTNGNITLSDNVSNYRYIEIFGYDTLFYSNVYTKYDLSMGQNINISHLSTNGGQNRLQTAIYEISGTSMTLKNAYMNVIFGTSINSQKTDNEFNITKVIGYK